MDTPRTDAAEQEHNRWHDYMTQYGHIEGAAQQAPVESDPFHIARSLERDLAAAQAQLLTAVGQIQDLQIRAQSAALRAHPQPVPEGWKLVPVEPTEEMQQAWHRGIWSNPSNPDENLATSVQTMFAHAYRAMLAAAPGAPK